MFNIVVDVDVKLTKLLSR